MPRGTVRTVQSSHFFACLDFWIERDIFLIRISFDKVNIPPESGRRDGCNDTGFVAFWALSFLSIFKPCQASRSDSGSKKAEKCIFIGYKYGVQGYKLWNPETKKTIYSRDVFREVKDVSKQEFLPTQDEPEKIELELDDEKSKSSEEEEEK